MRFPHFFKSLCWQVSLMLFTLLSLVAVVPSATAGSNDKVQVCHIPPGNPANFHTISVNQNAVNSHLAHGDKLGACSLHCESLCNDGNACTIDACIPGTETCQSPTSRQAVDCNDTNACTTDSCNPTTGCVYTPRTGASCNDGNACTTADACNAQGNCTGTALTCTASDQCHAAGVCNPSTGLCSNPVKANGTACTDSNACTQTDTCQAGVCTGSNPVTCTASDQCQQSTCHPTTGQCVASGNKPDGSACVNANTCTQNDICQGGTCVDGTPVADGTVCEDGRACTLSSSCRGGACASENPACRDEALQNDKGYCDLSTGQCMNVTAPCPEFFIDAEGNENKCTVSQGVDPDTGLCLYNEKNCAPRGCEQEQCNPATGMCETVPTPSCNFGECTNGIEGTTTPCPVRDCTQIHCSPLSAATVNCNTVVHVNCTATNPSTCQIANVTDPPIVGSCREGEGCLYNTVTCDPPADPCMELVMDGTEAGCCTYRPKDCAGEFGNNPNYTYSCEVVGSEGVCRATPK